MIYLSNHERNANDIYLQPKTKRGVSKHMDGFNITVQWATKPANNERSSLASFGFDIYQSNYLALLTNALTINQP